MECPIALTLVEQAKRTSLGPLILVVARTGHDEIGSIENRRVFVQVRKWSVAAHKDSQDFAVRIVELLETSLFPQKSAAIRRVRRLHSISCRRSMDRPPPIRQFVLN